MKKTCVICNESFQTAYPRKLTCSDDCGKIHHRIKANENRAKNQSKPKKVRKPIKSNMDKIAEKDKKAKELGVSYGGISSHGANGKGQKRKIKQKNLRKEEEICTKNLENLTV